MANCPMYPLVFDVFVLGFIIIDGGLEMLDYWGWEQ